MRTLPLLGKLSPLLPAGADINGRSHIADPRTLFTLAHNSPVRAGRRRRDHQHAHALEFLVGLCFVTSSTLAGAATTDANDGATLSVELLTMGPGDHPFFKFGHNALRIRDAARGTDNVYNYGTFSFRSPTLVTDFFKGRQLYWLSRETMANTLLHYGNERRWMIAQRLALSAPARVALNRYLQNNARDENRYYRYDYFFDNCSTRIRDALDWVTAGQIRGQLGVSARQTLREHALRSTADYLPEYIVLLVGLGPLVDRPVSRWEEAFLPEMLMHALRDVRLVQPDGTSVPCVESETVLLDQPDQRRRTAPDWKWYFLTAGCTVGAMLFCVARSARRNSRIASFLLGTSVLLGGLLTGLIGTALALLWAMTDHAVTYRNQNLLLLSPIGLVLAFYGIGISRVRRGAIGALTPIAGVLLGLSGLALLAKLLPMTHQDNAALLAFFIPAWGGIFAASLSAKH